MIVTAGSVRDFLEMFVDILPMSSSLTALANATMVCHLSMDAFTYIFAIPDSKSAYECNKVKLQIYLAKQ